MATEPILAALDVSAVQDRRVASSYAFFDYWKLTKPEINFLISITTTAGFWMGTAADLPNLPWMPFLHTLLGTAFVASGAATLNQLVNDAGDRVARLLLKREHSYLPVGDIEQTQKNVPMRITGWRMGAISTTKLAALIPPLLTLTWIAC